MFRTVAMFVIVDIGEDIVKASLFTCSLSTICEDVWGGGVEQ
jgi:hypothetical protein